LYFQRAGIQYINSPAGKIIRICEKALLVGRGLPPPVADAGGPVGGGNRAIIINIASPVVIRVAVRKVQKLIKMHTPSALISPENQVVGLP